MIIILPQKDLAQIILQKKFHRLAGFIRIPPQNLTQSHKIKPFKDMLRSVLVINDIQLCDQLMQFQLCFSTVYQTIYQQESYPLFLLFHRGVLPYRYTSFAKSPCRRRLSLVLLVCEKNKSKDLLWQGNQSELISGFFYVKSNALTYYYLIFSTPRALYNGFSCSFTAFAIFSIFKRSIIPLLCIPL